MDPELKKQIDELHALTKDNHRMLRAIRRDQWLGFIGKVIIWAIVLLLPLYLYQHYLQPLVRQFSANPGKGTAGFLGLPTAADLQKIISSYKTGGP